MISPESTIASRTSEVLNVQRLADNLTPIFYNELRRVARRIRHGGSNAVTMQTTALVNETYLKLRETKGWADDRHFLNAAALAMRSILVDGARGRLAIKRGGGNFPLPLDSAAEIADKSSADDMTVRLHDALELLAKESPRLGKVVECRYFGGFGDEMIARSLNMSVRSVRRDWAIARAWLHRELST